MTRRFGAGETKLHDRPRAGLRDPSGESEWRCSACPTRLVGLTSGRDAPRATLQNLPQGRRRGLTGYVSQPAIRVAGVCLPSGVASGSQWSSARGGGIPGLPWSRQRFRVLLLSRCGSLGMQRLRWCSMSFCMLMTHIEECGLTLSAQMSAPPWRSNAGGEAKRPSRRAITHQQ